jgi:hypothetical protein
MNAKMRNVTINSNLATPGIDKVEKYLLSLQSIKFDGDIFFDRRQSIEQNILMLMNENYNHNTIFADSFIKQTYKGKRRSFGDLFRLYKYYDNSITLVKFRLSLNMLVKEMVIASYHCSVIKKRV